MHLELGRKGDYAVRSTLDLARHHGRGRRKSREIAAATGVPERYLPQILAELVRAGYLVAVAGPLGGYALARPPAEISLLEVIETAEGPMASNSCALRGGPCNRASVCELHEPWSRAQQALMTELRKTTFADLAGERRRSRRAPLRTGAGDEATTSLAQ